MEPKSSLDATRLTQNLDTNCSKTDFQSIVKDNCKHLNADQQKNVLQLLMKYELLFDSTVGDWKTKPVSFQLKESETPLPQPSSLSVKNTQKFPHQRN